MRLLNCSLILITTALAGFPQKPDSKSLSKVAGFHETGRVAMAGLELRRPKISTDGRSIAFISTSPEAALWLASVNDSKPRLLAKASGDIQGYTWSPDNEQIVFTDGRTVRAIDVVSQAVTSYSTVSPFRSRPVFDGDGNLVFVANTDLTGNQAALDEDMEKIKAISPRDRPYLAVMRRDGRVITEIDQPSLIGQSEMVIPFIFRPGGRIYLRVEGADKNITPPVVGQSQPNCLDAILSPDRRKVALHCIGTEPHLSVYEIPSKMRYSLGVVADPASWSPDSEHLLIQTEISDGHAVFWNDLYLTHFTGGKRLKIVRAKGTVHGASWGKDGLIAYEEEGKIVLGKLTLK